MNTDFTTSFLKAIDKVPEVAVMEAIERVILSVEDATTLRDIANLRKLKKCRNGTSYRIRIGNYRIGVEILGNTVTFAAFGHRKDIYKSFPR